MERPASTATAGKEGDDAKPSPPPVKDVEESASGAGPEAPTADLLDIRPLDWAEPSIEKGLMPPPDTVGEYQERIKIVGGNDAPADEFPFATPLIRGSRGNTWDHYCGAVPIHPKWLLTAAHCPVEAGHHAAPGASSIKSVASSDLIKIARVKRHKRFDEAQGARYDYDLALLELEEEWDGEVLDIEWDSPTQGASVVAIGWGAQVENGRPVDKLQYLKLTVTERSACRKAHSGFGRVTSRMFCAEVSGGDTCAGDSGGPLLAGESGAYSVIGVVSWGDGCARSRPGVYVDVPELRDWIWEIVE